MHLPTALGVLVIGIALSACQSSERPLLNGRVSLEYNATAGSSTNFELVNGSAQTISFRGWDHFLTATEPMDREWLCRSAESAYPADAPMGLRDGPYTIIEVAPGKRKRLDVKSDEPNKYKHGRCRLRLWLWKGTTEGTIVESSEFEPQ
jgi:hypothetical protein